MIKHLYIRLFARNSEQIIANTILHYKQWASKIYVIDNYSTDATRAIARDLGAVVENDVNKGLNNDFNLTAQKNKCMSCSWGGNAAIITCDADEILYTGGRNPVDILNYWVGKGYGVVKPVGYEIFSDSLPDPSKQILEQEDFVYGIRDANYDKTILYKSSCKIRFEHGCHKSNPSLPVADFDKEIKLLHYRSIGGVENLISKYREKWATQSQQNLKFGMGIHYNQSEEVLREWWKDCVSRKERLV